jgi:hypothetical protein
MTCRVNQGPPVAVCGRCQAKIIFDGYIRNPKGVCIPLNPDYSRHTCYDRTITKNEIDLQAINYLEFITSKINKGLYHHRVKLIIEETYKPGELVEPRPAITRHVKSEF